MTAHPLDEHAPLAVLDDHARDHARTHPEARDLITRQNTALIRRLLRDLTDTSDT